MLKSRTSRVEKEMARAASIEIVMRAARETMAGFTMLTKPDYELTPYHCEICEALDAVVSGACPRLILTMPPRHGKSELVSRRLPAFFLARHPTAEIISTSYGAELSKTFSRDVQRCIESDVYRALFPKTRLQADSSAVGRWETTTGGKYLAQGVGGSITGHGADLLIIDDLISNREAAESGTQLDKMWDYYTGSLYTRLHPGARIVVIMTRWSPGDLVGRILANEDSAAWRMMHFPAINDSGDALWPSHYSRSDLDKIRDNIGKYDFESLYQGRPYARGGQYLKRDWFKRIPESEVPKGLQWHRGLDLAVSIKTTADFSASVKIARHIKAGVATIFIAGGWAARLDWPNAKRKIVSIAQDERIRLGVEAVAGFMVAHRELKAALNGVCIVTEIPVTRDKLSRALPWIAAAEAGRVVLVESEGSNEWIPMFLGQAEAFPAAGTHDDLVDAVSIAYESAAFSPTFCVC